MKRPSSQCLVPVLTFFWLKALFSAAAQSTTATRRFWTPETTAQACRSSSRSLHVCDPDLILSGSEIEALEQVLQGNVLPVHCHQEIPDLQVAVALIQKMGLQEMSFFDDVDLAAEMFARSIHDGWGVGMVSPCGGTGSVVFLAVQDRAVYISRGQALEGLLTDRRLDTILEGMKPLLRRKNYGSALELAVEGIYKYVEMGETGWWEMALANIWIVWVLLFFAFVGWVIKKELEQRRQYAAVASQLNELDQARAEALQCKFRASSCPICLEAFPEATESSVTSERKGSEGKPLHPFPEATESSVKSERKGSDGKPLKLLRCGHVFDESCWADWVNSGNCQVDKCPICKAPVGPGDKPMMSTRPDFVPLTRRTRSNQEENIGETNSNTFVRTEMDPAAALRRYNMERIFRLGRLHHRYPGFVGSQELQRWSEPSYNGSLARDPWFLARDPSQVRNSNSSSRGGGSSSFGGGSSSGGRGGRW